MWNFGSFNLFQLVGWNLTSFPADVAMVQWCRKSFLHLWQGRVMVGGGLQPSEVIPTSHGPLPVTNGVRTPTSRARTPASHLFSAIYKGYNSIYLFRGWAPFVDGYVVCKHPHLLSPHIHRSWMGPGSHNDPILRAWSDPPRGPA